MTQPVIAVKRLPHGAGLPLLDYATEHSAGVDILAAVEADVILRPGERGLIPSGVAIALPPGAKVEWE